MTSQFAFLQTEWPDLYEAAAKAESLALPDARTACFYSRRALEIIVNWIYKHDASVRLPYQDHLSALIHEPTFRELVGPTILPKIKLIKDLGNQAVHSQKPIHQFDAVAAVRELFHIAYWLAHTYARGSRPAGNLAFDQTALPESTPLPRQTVEQLQKLEASLREKDEALTELLADKSDLDEELKRLRVEIGQAKKANAKQADNHDYSEAETRDYFIDLLLKEAGWALEKPGHDTEFPVTGMPNNTGEGFVDYVLWGDDGRPLGLVEAKRTRKSAQVGQQQAKLYADCLEKRFGRRPVIFYSNGYEHWLWDDSDHPPREVQGFYKKAELELIHQRRSTRKKLGEAEVDTKIVERFYQARAIRRIGEAFERDNDRKALIVMATGAGKTRTVIALCDLLMRCNWVKRVLFLADRVALVNQAVNAFKIHLPDSSPVNLVTEKDAQGRVYVSTYPTMMRQIQEMSGGQRRFGVGHFDLVIIDEAHRSVYQKYGAIFDFFDSLLVGLTATPKDEVDRDTYRLFDLERGVPTDAYALDDAVKDGYLVPPKAVSVPLKFQRGGIRYDDLPDEEKEQWDAIEWTEDGQVPKRVEADAVSKWLFNTDTVDKALKHLMTHGLKVAGGDRLAKTIVFAKNQDHAEFIADRFNTNYPHYKGEFARVIHCRLSYAQSLIDAFSQSTKAPHIAISVDMLDTGIDVPEVANLVFFKLVRSKTKFWQMLGRGTRLSPDLFGPGKDKEFFYVFDFCQNLEFFSQNPESTDGSVAASLTTRIFSARVQLITTLDQNLEETLVTREGDSALQDLRSETATILRDEVAAMNLDNFIVRPQRRLVEKYSDAESWKKLTREDEHELFRTVSVLPSEIETDDEEAKRFDLLMLNLQLARLQSGGSYSRLRDQVKAIAGLLEEKSSIPMVKDQMPLILSIQSEEWWEDVTVPQLEVARKKLRLLIKLIDKHERKPIYTDFEDEMEEGSDVLIPGFTAPDSYHRFRAKVRHFLKEHEDHVAIHKLRNNDALTALDLAELERILTESGLGSSENLEKAKTESGGLGLFVRSLIGLDRQAAKAALGTFLSGGNLKANQIEFLDEIVNHLTDHGAMEPGRLYESPYTDFSPRGVDGLFESEEVDKLILILEEVRAKAIA